MNASEPAAKGHPAGVLTGRKVLVAEDDPIQSRLVGQAWKKAGATVQSVCDGKAARDLLVSSGYGVLGSDWIMPELVWPRLTSTVVARLGTLLGDRKLRVCVPDVGA